MYRGKVCLFIAFACLFILSSSSWAAINYGDKTGSTMDYLQVTEDSGTDTPPLYGSPIVVGDTLLFSPTSFNSSSSGAGGSDITDGTLTTTIVPHTGSYIDRLTLFEFGDYTLSGTGGTSATKAEVAASIYITCLEIDGSSLMIPVFTNASLNNFSPPDGKYNLADDGEGSAVPWNGSLTIDVTGWLTSIGKTGYATKLLFNMDNVLTTGSELGTSAFIAKKGDYCIGLTAEIPEPASITLLSLGALALFRRKRN